MRVLILLALVGCNTPCGPNRMSFVGICIDHDPFCMPEDFYYASRNQCVTADGSPTHPKPDASYTGLSDEAFDHEFHRMLCELTTACAAEEEVELADIDCETASQPVLPSACPRQDEDAAAYCLGILPNARCEELQVRMPTYCVESVPTCALAEGQVVYDGRGHTAAGWTAETAMTWSDALDPAGDIDLATIDLAAGSTYVMRTYGLQADPVLSLFDPTGQLVAENDELSGRGGQRDAAIVFTPKYAGSYQLQVRDFSDWMGETPAGGPDATYTGLVRRPISEELPDNGIELLDTSPTVTWNNVWSHIGGEGWGDTFGVLDSADDVDLWPIEWGGIASGPYYVTGIILPDAGRSHEVELSLLDGEGRVLAVGDKVVEHGTSDWRDDASLWSRIEPSRWYYLRVRALDPQAEGPIPYAISKFAEVGSVFSLDEETPVNMLSEVEPNDEPDQATRLAFNNTNQLRWAHAWGELPEGDDTDQFTVPGGPGLPFWNLSATLRTPGSQLGARASVHDSTGRLLGTFEPEGDRLVVRDIELDTTDDLHIRVEAVTRGSDPLAQQYQLYVSIDEP